MRILVDADACPVKSIIEDVAIKYNIEVVMFYDTSHIKTSLYSKIIIVSKGRDSADYELINYAKKGDIVVTQDYGVACMALAKKCYAIKENGLEYDDSNIDFMLESRALNIKLRKNKNVRIHGPKKRTKNDDINFLNNFIELIERVK